MTDATGFTSMSSLTDSMTIASISNRSARSRRGSILKSPSSSTKPKLKFPKRRSSRISFSSTPNQVFTIERNPEYKDDMFYDQESLADFRYEALMWEAGMVDDNGTPVSIVQSTNETNDKYEQLDDLNGSLDFDNLILDEINPLKSNTSNPLEDIEQDKEYSRDAIKEMRKSIDVKDQQWKSTAELFSNLKDFDDGFDWNDDDIDSVAGDGDDGLDDDLNNPFAALDADVSGSGALSSKEKFEKQRRQFSFLKNKQKLEGHMLNQTVNNFNMEEDDVFSLEPSEDGIQESQSVDNGSQGSERSFACSFADEEDSQRSQRSLTYGDDDAVDNSQRSASTIVGDTSERSQLRKKLVKVDNVRQSLKSLSDVFLSSNELGDSNLSLDASAHSINNTEGDRRTRLMAKMKGLRESLRSIQDLEDINSDDDSEWGDDDSDEDSNNKAPKHHEIDSKNLKNLKGSLIVKHMIYSPVPNEGRGTIERLESVKEMTIPEL
ncbi:MAG: hypothetical protein SGBAC_006325 [Bacillariaceae sp.]